MDARGAFEFFDTSVSRELPHRSLAKKSSGATSAALEPGPAWWCARVSPVLLHRAFASASVPALTRGISLSPSRLRSKTHAGGSAPGSPSLFEDEVASVGHAGASRVSVERRDIYRPGAGAPCPCPTPTARPHEPEPAHALRRCPRSRGRRLARLHSLRETPRLHLR